MSIYRQEDYPHLNLTWNLAQMDRIMELARRGVTAADIAFQMGVATQDIVELAERNGFLVRTVRAAR